MPGPKPALREVARMRALEAREARLAFGVDLAVVERLALLLVAENFIGAVQLGEAAGRFRIVRVGVWMQLLGELPEGALDVARARPPRHPQNLIGVAHSVKLHVSNRDHGPALYIVASNVRERRIIGAGSAMSDGKTALTDQDRFQGFRLRTSQRP